MRILSLLTNVDINYDMYNLYLSTEINNKNIKIYQLIAENDTNNNCIVLISSKNEQDIKTAMNEIISEYCKGAKVCIIHEN